MMLNINPIYVIYLFSAIAMILVAEALYLTLSSTKSYRDNINRRLKLSHDQPDRGNTLVKLRKERGLDQAGSFVLPITALNRLILQAGVTFGAWQCVAAMAVITTLAFILMLVVRGHVLEAIVWAGVAGIGVPLIILRHLRKKRLKKFGERFPDAIDVIVRSLRAGHPVPVAVSLVGKEMPDPIGTEFGIAADELTYGSDLETAMRQIAFRVGHEDLPLFVTAIAIQNQTGGNLSEILSNLSAVIRMRFKMRRKIRALASEGKFSALALSAMPVVLMLVLHLSSPNYYGDVWHHPTLHKVFAYAGGWMLFGNYIMYRMVNFKF